MDSGQSVTKKLSREAWTLRYENTGIESANAFNQIGTVLSLIGNWSFQKKVLDIQTGLGVMVQLLNDNNYQNVRGTEADDVLEYWDNEEELIECEPDRLPIGSNEYDLVTWFSMCEGRVEESCYDEVLDEMIRVTKNKIVLKPFKRFDAKKDKEFINYMLGKRMRFTKIVPSLWYYVFTKE